jgi:hypothetical protein
VATGPAAIILAPPLAPPPTSLLRTAVVADHDEEHWGSAIEWPPENCSGATVVDPCAIASKGTGGNHPATIRYDAFIVHIYDQCSALGYQVAEYDGRVRRAIAAREAQAVEREWWTGTLWAQNPHLAKTAGANGPNVVSLAGGAAQSLRISLALLVQYIADLNGGLGMIHCRPYLAELWAGLQMIYRDNGGKLWTYTGQQVVAGHGYPGTGPTAQAISATSEWAYATDNVMVHRGPVYVPSAGVNPETLDVTTNTVTNRAERTYALAVNGCVSAAVNVNPTQTG